MSLRHLVGRHALTPLLFRRASASSSLSWERPGRTTRWGDRPPTLITLPGCLQGSKRGCRSSAACSYEPRRGAAAPSHPLRPQGQLPARRPPPRPSASAVPPCSSSAAPPRADGRQARLSSGSCCRRSARRDGRAAQRSRPGAGRLDCSANPWREQRPARLDAAGAATTAATAAAVATQRRRCRLSAAGLLQGRARGCGRRAAAGAAAAGGGAGEAGGGGGAGACLGLSPIVCTVWSGRALE